MESTRLQREQTKSEPVVLGGQKERVHVKSAPCRSLSFNDPNSPALRLDQEFRFARTLLPNNVQAKLTINEPGDQYEQEADRVAEQVMRMSDSPLRIQRKCGCGGSTAAGESCDECAEGSVQLQRHAKPDNRSGTLVPAIVHDVLRSPGQKMDDSTRSFMEARFGHDFSDVQVHSDAHSAESAQGVNALAYTVGRHLVFAPGEYAPASESGRRLLAHELTHVMQQTSGHTTQPRGLIQRQENCESVVYDEVNQVCRPFEESDREPSVPESLAADAEFFTRPPRLREGAEPILDDEEAGVIIGYRYSSSGYYEVYDLEGHLTEVGEAGLEAPLIDPIDILAGGLVGLGRGLIGAGGRSAARGMAAGAGRGGLGGAGLRGLIGAISLRSATALRAVYRAIRLRGTLNFTATTARHMAEAGRRVPIHILQLALRYGTRTPDPQGAAGAFRYVIAMSRGMVERGTGRWVYREYTLEVVIREADRTILHFLYR